MMKMNRYRKWMKKSRRKLCRLACVCTNESDRRKCGVGERTCSGKKARSLCPLPSLLSLCKPLGCAPLALFLVLRAFAHSADFALSHSLASPLCFHRPWVQPQGCAGGRRSGWNRQRATGGGSVHCWPGDGEGEANGEMVSGVVWESRGTDWGVLLVGYGLGQVGCIGGNW
jgi:hypothetical protein